MKKAIISPHHLKTLRERKKWTQRELAKKSGLTVRRISSLEKKKADQIPVQYKTFTGLCKALDERPEVLSGERPLTPEISPHKVPMQLEPQTRLNLDLLNKRYGLTIDDVMNVAPLLLVKAAEAALSMQASELKKDRKEYAQDRIQEYLQKDQTETCSVDEKYGLMFRLDNSNDLTEYFDAREDAISNQDIFESSLDCLFEFDGDRSNPFTEYLNEEYERHGISEIDKYEFFDSSYFRIPRYSICFEELKRITCGSDLARWALEQGMTTIPEIPDDLWKPRNAGKRVVWLEEKYHLAEAARTDEESMS